MVARGLTVALVFLVGLAVSTVWSRPASLLSESGRFRVATFNIHKGADRRDHYDLQRTIAAIARLDADLVGAQEVMRNHTGFQCDDQAALIAEGLSRLTGRRWSHVFVSARTTEDRDCLARGQGDGVATEGLAFFAPDRIIASASVRLSPERMGLAVRTASMPSLSVVVTHLEASRQNQAGRAGEIAVLLPWIDRLRAPILIGDFNARPESPELEPVRARYRDAWNDATAQGLIADADPGARPRRRRIDYVYFDPAVDLVLESVAVVSTASPGTGGEVSDHQPVVATFRRKTTRS